MYPFNKEELIQKFDGLSKPEAKAGLEEFAHVTWGIDLNKKKTFDNMLVELEEKLQETTKSEIVEEQHVEIESTQEVEATVTEASTVKVVEKSRPSNGYIQLGWWFYEWIVANDDWKEKINQCHFYNAKSVLGEVKDQIDAHGSVVIRESRNSKFVVLK